MILNTRMLTGTTTLSSTDEIYILNDTNGNINTGTLPAGTDGQVITGVIANTNTGIFSLATSGTDTLDPYIATAHGQFTFLSGVWYLCG